MTIEIESSNFIQNWLEQIKQDSSFNIEVIQSIECNLLGINFEKLNETRLLEMLIGLGEKGENNE